MRQALRIASPIHSEDLNIPNDVLRTVAGSLNAIAGLIRAWIPLRAAVVGAAGAETGAEDRPALEWFTHHAYHHTLRRNSNGPASQR